MKNKKAVFWVWLMMTFALSSTISLAATLFVDASRPDDSGDGSSWASAKQTIQAAVDQSADGDTVWVTNGTYDLGGAAVSGQAQTNRVCITLPVTVRSVNGPDFTTILGAAGSNGSNDVDSVRGVCLTTNATLSGFTVSGGYSVNTGNYTYDRPGAGIWLTTGAVVSNCVITIWSTLSNLISSPSKTSSSSLTGSKCNSLTLNFSANYDAELDSETVYDVYFEYITRASGSYTLENSASQTADLTWVGTDLDHIQTGDYLVLTGWTTPANDGEYLVNSTGSNTMSVTIQNTNVTLTDETATVQVDENPFGSLGATIVNDNSGTPMTGEISSTSIGWDFDYTNNNQEGRTAGSDAPIHVIAIALDGSEWGDATHTITAATGQSITVNGNDERNYSNPT